MALVSYKLLFCTNQADINQQFDDIGHSAGFVLDVISSFEHIH